MNIDQLEHIIERYLSGKATEQEKTFVARWLEERPEDELPLDAGRRVSVKAALWQAVSNRSGAIPENKEKAGRLNIRIWHRYAAAIIIVIAGALTFHYVQNTGTNTSVSQLVSAQGKTKILILPDSSQVYLFPGATLSVPDNYNEADRRIALAGRAFFQIRHNPSRPFYVEAGAISTLVLGTSFEIITASNLPSTVTVRTGKVAVQYNGRTLAELTANKRMRYDSAQHDFVIDDVDAASLGEWQTQGLAFDQVPLQEVLHELSNWFQIPIEVADAKWKSEPVTIRIKEENISAAITLLSQTLGFRFKQTGNSIIIY